MKRRRKKSWSKQVARYIAQEMRSNAHKKRKRPWNQVVAIGFARARKAGVHVPVNPHTGRKEGQQFASWRSKIRRSKHSK